MFSLKSQSAHDPLQKPHIRARRLWGAPWSPKPPRPTSPSTPTAGFSQDQPQRSPVCPAPSLEVPLPTPFLGTGFFKTWSLGYHPRVTGFGRLCDLDHYSHGFLCFPLEDSPRAGSGWTPPCASHMDMCTCWSQGARQRWTQGATGTPCSPGVPHGQPPGLYLWWEDLTPPTRAWPGPLRDAAWRDERTLGCRVLGLQDPSGQGVRYPREWLGSPLGRLAQARSQSMFSVVAAARGHMRGGTVTTGPLAGSPV